MSNPYFKTSIEFLKGVGPKRAELLRKELGIFTYQDILQHYPFRYVDRSKFHQIKDLRPDNTMVQLVGEIKSISTIGVGRKMRLVARFADETSSMDLVWFKGVKWLQSSLKIGHKYVVFGKPSSFNGVMNMVHPEMEDYLEYKNSVVSGLQPVYPSTEKLNSNGLSSKNIEKLTRQLLKDSKEKIPENLSANVLQKYVLINRREALLKIHFPPTIQEKEKAAHRLKFEELFFIQMELLKLKLVNSSKSLGFNFSEIGEYVNAFYKDSLPFELTGAQKRVVREIRRDLGSGKHMNRLLQGDVGSGKTAVAIMAMMMALDNGFQACMMAPTEILATQHFESVKEYLDKLGVKFALLTGATKSAERKKILNELEEGILQVLIGTHALIEDKVMFKNLGIAVVDEQHRFGVAQRAKLWRKNSLPPHMLIMSATPIPRTLAMTLYGDLDVSVIDELPPGRKAITTMHWHENKRLRLVGFMREEIKKGRQIYIVYPLIEESEKLDYANLQQGYESVFAHFPPPEYKVSIVHGKMPAASKEFEMQRFIAGETNILVSTTVIEVGVNVPNASVMVIESAERFGLSQLHQLRGRVGRGAEQSYCILMTGNKLSADARLRMKTMCSTNDGFQIAEVDLKLRGPGDLQGTQQSGTPFNLKLANLATDGALIQTVRNAAQEILNHDPELQLPEHSSIRNELIQRKKGKINWGKIS